MRELNTTEVAAVSGGFFCFKPAAPAPACGCKPNPLSFVLGFLGGAVKLLTTGVPSNGTPCPAPKPTTPPVLL